MVRYKEFVKEDADAATTSSGSIAVVQSGFQPTISRSKTINPTKYANAAPRPPKGINKNVVR